jgi:hypothetical protein
MGRSFSVLISVIGLELVGTIKGSFADVDLDKLESRISKDGIRVYRIFLALAVKLGSQDGTLMCRMLMRGREIGKATIDFAYR